MWSRNNDPNRNLRLNSNIQSSEKKKEQLASLKTAHIKTGRDDTTRLLSNALLVSVDTFSDFTDPLNQRGNNREGHNPGASWRN